MSDNRVFLKYKTNDSESELSKPAIQIYKVKNANTFIFLFLTSLVAILSDQLVGSISALVIFDLPAELFESVVLIYPVERIILAFVSALIMFMLAAVLHNILVKSDEIDYEIEQTKKEILLDYAINDVKPLLEKEIKRK